MIKVFGLNKYVWVKNGSDLEKEEEFTVQLKQQ